MIKGKITTNFSWSEFFRSHTAIRTGINNVPDSDYVYENIRALTENVLQPLRDEMGPILITSGYRSPKLNNRIGGSRTSNHLIGCAADIEPIHDNIKLIDILEWIHKNCDYKELIAEYFPEGWVHVAYQEGKNHRQVKIKNHKYYYVSISVEQLKDMYKDK